MKVPSFLMVLVGVGDYAYRRLDGVYVVPIGFLQKLRVSASFALLSGTFRLQKFAIRFRGG